MNAKLLRRTKMKTTDQGVTAPLIPLVGEDHDFQRIPHLPGNQHGVYLR